jgi:hypothetical protein
MVNSRITLFGKIDKDPKVNEDGTIDLIVTNEIEEDAKKDIKKLGKSIFLIRLTNKQAETYIKKLKKDNIYLEARGYVKSMVNKKGAPYIYISPDSINYFDEEKEKKKLLNKKPKINNIKTKVNEPEINKKSGYVDWRQFFEPSDFVTIHSSKIKIVDEEHLNAKLTYVNLEMARNTEKKISIAVRPLENGEYALVSGIRKFIAAKVLEKSVDCYITDLNSEEFKEKFCKKQIEHEEDKTEN